MAVKEDLDAREHRPPLVSEGDVWWMSVGANVGTELDGKGRLFTRPAIIYKKLARDFYFVIPATTRPREGSWYVPYWHQGRRVFACLHQARSINHRRLSDKMGALDEADFEKVQKGFRELYGI